MPFLIKDEKLLEKCSEIWKKISNVIKNEFDSRPVYNEKYLKSKIKSYTGKSTQIFTTIKNQEKILNVFVISVILIDSVYRKNKSHPQVFLGECKYFFKEKKTSKFITDVIECRHLWWVFVFSYMVAVIYFKAAVGKLK